MLHHYFETISGIHGGSWSSNTNGMGHVIVQITDVDGGQARIRIDPNEALRFSQAIYDAAAAAHAGIDSGVGGCHGLWSTTSSDGRVQIAMLDCVIRDAGEIVVDMPKDDAVHMAERMSADAEEVIAVHAARHSPKTA